MTALSQAAARRYKHSFQLVRAEGFYDRGVYKRTGTTITPQFGNFQPASQSDIERLPEGARTDGALVLFTAAFMRAAAAPNQVADRIMYDSVEYEVGSTFYWSSHNRYTLTKVGQ